MKLRTGFVSNSSSASFVIRWKYELPFNDYNPTLNMILANFYGLGVIHEEEKQRYNHEKDLPIFYDWDDIEQEMFEVIKDITKIKSSNRQEIILETEFRTSMNNGNPYDFNKAFPDFVTRLMMIENGACDTLGFEKVKIIYKDE